MSAPSADSGSSETSMAICEALMISTDDAALTLNSPIIVGSAMLTSVESIAVRMVAHDTTMIAR